MSTKSQIIYEGLRERYDRYLSDFINAKRGSIDDNVEVLRARLFGLGFRKSELQTEVNLAIEAKRLKRAAK